MQHKVYLMLPLPHTFAPRTHGNHKMSRNIQRSAHIGCTRNTGGLHFVPHFRVIPKWQVEEQMSLNFKTSGNICLPINILLKYPPFRFLYEKERQKNNSDEIKN